MKQGEQQQTAQTVLCQHMAWAALRGDMKALTGHALVYQTIIDRAKSNT